MIKYTDVQITFREVPDEVSLSINISNCPYHCNGCHSPYLQKDIGKELTVEVLDELIDIHKDEITCVTFLGDGGNINEMSRLIEHCAAAKKLKTCLYTGSDDKEELLAMCCGTLSYLKTGPYIEELGGLDSETTNQRFYKIVYTYESNGLPKARYIDLTYRFRIKY